jgi:hypothetical protein
LTYWRPLDPLHLGEPDVVVRTLRSAAETHLILGDRRRAAEILARALAAIAAAESNGVAFPAEDVLGVLVSQLDAGEGYDVDVLHRALSLASLAVEDANAWWDLPRLAAHVGAHPEVARATGRLPKGWRPWRWSPVSVWTGNLERATVTSPSS